MDIIHLLPDSVANQIAAGEVIQRPSSCLKELVENSLDAGATHIQVIVRDAGRTLLQVIDNGSGMSATDARMAFERHATSKISSAADLFSLRTMGFRGEALASICAVAQVSLTTRREEDEVGTLLEINGSEVVRQEPCQCAVGTNLKVKNLFFNVPARRRFLKTDATELRNLLQDFYRIALVYPRVQFTFVVDDEIVHELTAGTHKQRIEQIFQRNTRRQFSDQLLDVKVNTQIVNIFGFIGRPEAATKGNPQYFFVNGRYMKHPYFHKAVMNAYTGMLQADQAPSYFLYFDIVPEAIDVNIHPTKTEIKFADEQSIFQILMAAVRESLGKFNITPSLDFNREGDYEITTRTSAPTSIPKISVDRQYNPFNQTPNRPPVPSNWQQLYTSRSESNIDSKLLSSAADDTSPLLELAVDQVVKEQLWQYAGKYIFMPTPQGLRIFDQHRAHICVMYDMFMSRFEHSQSCTQQLLFPDTLDLSAEDAVILNDILTDLNSLGFDIDIVGPQSFVINGIPAELAQSNDVRILIDLLADVATMGNARDKLHSQISLTLARKVAIPYGKSLSADEMADLITRLIKLDTPSYTPDGKTVSALLDDKMFYSLFK